MAGANKTAFLFTRVVASASARSEAARPQLIAHSAHARLYLPSPHLQGYVADIDELTTSIVGIDFPKEDKPKRNRRMECMLCAPGETAIAVTNGRFRRRSPDPT